MPGYDRLLRPRTSTLKHDASFWRRTGAFGLDVLILDALVTAPFTPLFSPLFERAKAHNWMVTFTTAEATAAFVVCLIIFCYFTLFEYLLGQTPGMMIVHTRVDRMPNLRQAIIRNWFLIPVIPFIFLWVIEPITLALTRQSLMERLSQTRTVYERTVIV